MRRAVKRTGTWGMIVLIAALALAPAGCGRKGSPVLPAGKTDTFPNQYPRTTDPQTGVFN